MKNLTILFLFLFCINSIGQTCQLVTKHSQSFINQVDTTYDQIIWLSDYNSHDYEYLFNHSYQSYNDIHITTRAGHRLPFTDVNNNGVIDVVGNSITQGSSEVGYAEYRPNAAPIFQFISDFTLENYWPEKITDLNNDNSDEILTGSIYPFLNVFNNDGSFIRTLPVRAQWGDQKPLIADIDGNNKIDFVIDQYLNNEHTINFYEYDYLNDSLILITKIDSIMRRIITNEDTLDTLVHVEGDFSDFVFGDLDNDGLIEVASGHVAGLLNIFKKKSTGYIQVYFDNLLTFNMYQIAITNDIDLNGKKELIIMGNYDGGPLFWIEADGNNSYNIKRNDFIDYGPNISILTMNMYATDVDLDGRDDLVFIGRSLIWILKWNIVEGKWDMLFYLDTNRDYDDNMWGNGHDRSFPGLVVNTEFYDIDNDGDKDMFVSTDQDVTLFFESNLIVLEVEDTLSDILPESFKLSQNFPNPFNPTTTIKYSIPSMSLVNIKIYNSIGEEILELVNEVQPVGNYKVKFEASNLPSGIYFYRLKSGAFLETKKMVLLR